MVTHQILVGHVLDRLKDIPDNSVQCIVTSIPYWGLRDYGLPPVTWPDGWIGCLGLEPTPRMFVEHVVLVFREIRRVLAKDGTCWVNVGDSYAARGLSGGRGSVETGSNDIGARGWRPATPGFKLKDRCMIPARVAISLQEDGWWLRDEIVWQKPNPMPSSVTDRTTPAHEMIYLLTKSRRYFYDAEAIKEPVTGNAHARGDGVNPKAKMPGANSRVHVSRNGGAPPQSRQNESFSAAVRGLVDTRNKRSVWSIATQPFPEAHFATFPEELPKLCILAGSREGDTVLDPFLGSGTTAAVALRLGRSAIGIEMNPAYAEIARKRISAETPAMQFGEAV